MRVGRGEGHEAAPGASKATSRGAAKPPSQRQFRVAEEIRHVLADIFARGEVRDPDLAGVTVTVTEVRVGADLKRATAFVTRLGRSDIAAKLPALRRAAPFLRSRIAREVRLQHVPSLSFEADTSIDYAIYVDNLLRAPAVARDLAAAKTTPDSSYPGAAPPPVIGGGADES